MNPLNLFYFIFFFFKFKYYKLMNKLLNKKNIL